MSGRPIPFRRHLVSTLLAVVVLPTLAFAQSPWERAANNLALTFTGPLARSLALVAIVIGGLMFMFGEAGANQISGIVFGVGWRCSRRSSSRGFLTRRKAQARGSGHGNRPTCPTCLQGAHRPLTICGCDRRLFFWLSSWGPRPSICSTRSLRAC